MFKAVTSSTNQQAEDELSRGERERDGERDMRGKGEVKGLGVGDGEKWSEGI